MSRRAVTVRVPGKVNLQLSVGGARDDGYHDVVSVFQAVSLFDDVAATQAPPGAGISVAVSGQQRGVPTDHTNLAARAAQLLADHAGVEPDVHLRVDKMIPVSGGMAGGSADAAGALLACDALWDTRYGRDQLLALASRLGADVPFSLVGGTAVGVDRGDRLTPALVRSRFHWVFALADEAMSTPAVYRELDRLRDGERVRKPTVSDSLMHALGTGDAAALGLALRNDLEPAAISLLPSLARTLDVGYEYGALGSVVSGSGPTCAFLVQDADDALDLAVALSAAGVCRTVKRAHGPVPGARLVDH
ncbi:MAG: 4-(cytidine 5'-diphospho)-2-C-methyl-D-erythritol kinase [Candidatus Nanopelagicales bacterium]